jgi:hypothetical protein
MPGGYTGDRGQVKEKTPDPFSPLFLLSADSLMSMIRRLFHRLAKTRAGIRPIGRRDGLLSVSEPLSDHFFGWKVLVGDTPVAILEHIGTDPQLLLFKVYPVTSGFGGIQELFSLARAPNPSIRYQNMFSKEFIPDEAFIPSTSDGMIVRLKDVRHVDREG